jgi:hypothetical protein
MTQILYLTTLVIFAALAFGVAFLPVRWALFCLLLSTNLNVIQPDFWSATSVGWSNGVEALVLPTLLLFRLTGFRMPDLRWGFVARTWLVLTLYAAVSIAWSPFKLPGIKMVGYLIGWALWFILLELAWRRGIADSRLVIAALWGSLALAFVQTYLLGNPEEPETAQFTSFTAAASFATFVLACLAFLLFQPNKTRLRVVSIAACLLALILAGDRTSLIGLAFVLFAWFLHRQRRSGRPIRVRLAPLALALVGCIVLFLGIRALMASVMPESRLNELLQLGSRQFTSVEDIGTAVSRFELYQRTISELAGRSTRELLIGSGTSSGGEVASKWEVELDAGLDANRVIHDEFLRALYEWGLIGIGVALALVGWLIRWAWRAAVSYGSVPAFSVLAVVPMILLLLLTANPLAGPGSAEGVGVLLIMAYGWLGGPSRLRHGYPLLQTKHNELLG